MKLIKTIIISLLFIKSCQAESERVVLNLAKDGKHDKFFKTRHLYRGIEYYTITPLPGYIIGQIVFNNVTIYEKKEIDDVVEGAYLFYNPYNHDIPVFIIKTAAMRTNIYPIGGRSPIDEEHMYLVRTLMRFIRVMMPRTSAIRRKLRNLDDTADPVERTVSSITYRVYNGTKHIGGTMPSVERMEQAAASGRDPKQETPMDTTPSTSQASGGASNMDLTSDETEIPMDTS